MGSTVARPVTGVAACPPYRLSRRAFRDSARRWVASAYDERDGKRRSKAADRLLKLVGSIQRRLAAGKHLFRLARRGVVADDRGVAIASPLDSIILRAILDRCLRNPRLGSWFKDSYAMDGKGRQTAARAVCDATASLVAVHGEITVVAFDARRAYRSASVDRALDRMAELEFGRDALAALRVFYQLVHTDRRFRGIQEGLCTSSLLFEFALLPFDAAARGTVGAYFRYADNVLVILPGRVGMRKAQKTFNTLAVEFSAAEGWRLKLHKWDHAHFAKSTDDTIQWLGFEFVGSEVRIPQVRLERALKKARAAKPGKQWKVVEGFLGNYSGVVEQHEIDHARAKLLKELSIADGRAIHGPARKRTRRGSRMHSPPYGAPARQGPSMAASSRPGPKAAVNTAGGGASGPSSRRAGFRQCLGVEDCARYPVSIRGERLDDMAYLHRCGDIFTEFVPRGATFNPPRQPSDLGGLVFAHTLINWSHERENIAGRREADLRLGLPLPEDCIGDIRYLLCGEHLRQAARMHLALAVCQCVVPGRTWEHDRRFLRTLGTVVIQHRFQIYGMACVAAVFADQPGARRLANRAALNLRPFRLPDNAESFLESLAEAAVINGEQAAQLRVVEFLATGRSDRHNPPCAAAA